jgi:hypothetical protein
MMTLAEFLAARLGEDEADAEAACGSHWTAQDPDDDYEADRVWVSGDRGLVCRAGFRTADHIARHDPARVLREVEAMRGILEAHRRVPTDSGLAVAVHHLATVYADHPDYDEAWRP